MSPRPLRLDPLGRRAQTRLSALVTLVIAGAAACTGASPSSSTTSDCPLVSALHAAGDSIAAVSSAEAGDAAAATQKGREAQRRAQAVADVLNTVPAVPGDEAFRTAAKLSVSNIEQASYGFVGFVAGEPPSLDDMAASSAVALASVRAALQSLDTQATVGGRSLDLCRATIADDVPAT
jgi:hypothetical protein